MAPLTAKELAYMHFLPWVMIDRSTGDSRHCSNSFRGYFVCTAFLPIENVKPQKQRPA
jgi:hypothetical protein